MAQQNQTPNNQNDHPIWDFVRSMDNLGINPEPSHPAPQRDSDQGQRAGTGPTGPYEVPPQLDPNAYLNMMSGGFFPHPPGMGGHPEMGGPPRGPGGRGSHQGRRGGPHHGGMGWGGPLGGMGASPFSWAAPPPQWGFNGPPRGPGHRGRHHGRRRRSPTPSSSGSSRSRSRSHSRPRPRSASPHAERGHSTEGPRPERTASAAEDFPFGPHGPPPPHPHPHPHPHHAGPPHGGPHHPGGRRGRRGPHPRGPPPPPFDINAFLATLTSHPLAQNIMQNFMPSSQARNATSATEAAATNDATSFTPPLDLFTTPTSYTIHISLPGAKKEDIGVHFSPTTSTLAISGVVHKPGSEDFLATMTSSERRDFGMFERNVVLEENGLDGGAVDAEGISAKLEDGILIVTVPRFDREWEDVKKVEIE